MYFIFADNNKKCMHNNQKFWQCKDCYLFKIFSHFCRKIKKILFLCGIKNQNELKQKNIMDSVCSFTKEERAIAWVPTQKSDLFTSDQLIDAYMNGKKEGMEQYKKLEMSKMEENIKKSGIVAVDIINELKNNKFTPIDTYLRVNSFDRFDIMVTVPENDFLKDEFLYMYDMISDIETKSKNDFYMVFISFCSTNNHFDEQIVVSDGYSWKLEKK